MEKRESFFHVEANFGDGRGWKRNHQQHETLDAAHHMAVHFLKIADVRIVKIEVTELLVWQKQEATSHEQPA